jgi:hypothetical protein
MKKYSGIILTVLLSMTIIVGCEKNGTKDYTALIKNRTWWGQLTNPGETIQYYCVYFKSDGNLIWSQREADYAGKWVVDKNQVTMDFPVLSVQIKADISDDNKLTNIVSSNSSIVTNANLIPNPTLRLDNTQWNGILVQSGGTSESFQLNFLTGAKVDGKVGSAGIGNIYTRSESGAVIRFTLGPYPFFAIITTDKEMRGQWKTFGSYYMWQTTLQ